MIEINRKVKTQGGIEINGFKFKIEPIIKNGAYVCNIMYYANDIHTPIHLYFEELKEIVQDETAETPVFVEAYIRNIMPKTEIITGENITLNELYTIIENRLIERLDGEKKEVYPLRIKELDWNFNIKTSSVANTAIKSNVVYNEFNGTKEKSIYINDNGEIVAEKTFTLYNGTLGKGTSVKIDYFNTNNEVGATIETKDIYSNQQIEEYKTKCASRVLDRLFYDIKETIEVINANGMMQAALALEQGSDHLFKEILFKEVQIIKANGSTKPLYEAVDLIQHPLLEMVFPTSVEQITVRQILKKKFNPANFNFYE